MIKSGLPCWPTRTISIASDQLASLGAAFPFWKTSKSKMLCWHENAGVTYDATHQESVPYIALFLFTYEIYGRCTHRVLEKKPLSIADLQEVLLISYYIARNPNDSVYVSSYINLKYHQDDKPLLSFILICILTWVDCNN